jgi:hypothetical protein
VTHQRLEFYLERFPAAKFFELVDESEDPLGYRLQRRIEQAPYWIAMEEVTRVVFECDRLPTEDDYLLKANYSFATLADVDHFLTELGFSLSEINWGADVDFL